MGRSAWVLLLVLVIRGGSAFAQGPYPCTVTRLSPATCFGVRYDCTSTSHHTFDHGPYEAGLPTTGWTTRITGRLAGGPDVFDVSVNSVVPPESDAAVKAAFDQARAAIVAAAGHPVQIAGPTLLSSSSSPVTTLPFGTVSKTTDIVATLQGFGNPYDTVKLCVGELGDLLAPPSRPYRGPCPSTAWEVTLTASYANFCIWMDGLTDTNTYTEIDVYPNLVLTGTLTTSHYELVGEGGSSALTVPVVLSSTGLTGATFTSELALTNRGTTDSSISYAYTAAQGGASGTAADSLAAATQKVIPDAIAYLKSLGIPVGDSGNRVGTLRITFSDLSSSDAGAATLRTTAAVPDGRAGFAYAGLPSSKLLSSPVYIPALRQNAMDRSNVAVLNAGVPADGDITLRLTVVSGDPASPGTKALPDITLSPGGFSQVSGILGSNGLSLTNGTVKVERVSGTAPFYAYGVINDQANSDGSFVEPVPANPASVVAGATLPVLVETSAFSSELVLTNFTSTARTLRLTYVSSALTGGSVTFSVQLLPNEQQILPAFVQLLRDRGVISDAPGPGFAGALFASDASGDLRGVSIGARVSSPGGGGRYGLFFSAVPAGAEATTSAWLYGLQQNSENRTNLALVNVGSADSSSDTFHIDLYDGATGQKAGSTDVTVPARGFVQIDRILARFAPGTATGYALVTRTSGNNPFIAYAVINDGGQPGQRSGDGALIAASIPAP